MSIVKTKLKSALDYIGKKDYNNAKKAVLQVLDYEPDNYNANVFLGLASLELGDYDEGEQAYKKAIDSKPEQLTAWQGLSKFYEKREEWDKYADTLERLMKIHAQKYAYYSPPSIPHGLTILRSNDAVKCGETVQKYIDLRRNQRDTTQVGLALLCLSAETNQPKLVNALSFLLPESPYYQVLSSLPLPDHTAPEATTTFQVQVAVHNTLIVLEEIIELVERQEEDYAKKEFEKRRTRLNAGTPEEIRQAIGREVWGTSKLPALYSEVLNHPNTSDELRRKTDSKLLRYKLQHLHSFPTSASDDSKNQVAAEVAELIKGVIILKIPDELAWTLYLDGKDAETIGKESSHQRTFSILKYNVLADYDLNDLRQFIELFPSQPLTMLLRGYFLYSGIPLDEDDAEEDETANLTYEDRDAGYDMIQEAYTSMKSSTNVLTTRVLVEVYLQETDYANAIETADLGLKQVKKFELSNSTSLPRVQLSFQVVLATSLVHLFPPKHHRRAKGIIEEILTVSPDNVPALMGRGYILEEEKQWKEAAEIFARVQTLVPEEDFESIRPREEHAWCLTRLGDMHEGIPLLEEVLKSLNEHDGTEHDRARCNWRLGKSHWDLDGEKRGEAYKYFIVALKCDPDYAPAFTSLGLHYSEYADPPDPTRASKCFQKAFELDPRESVAASRLARGFADEQDWDLVEVVARRIIEGEGGFDGGGSAVSGSVAAKFLPTNVWAWKAVGIVELTRRKYNPAITAFQVALRAEPEDHLTWLRLGEAYYRSGKHNAALKALDRAHSLEPDDWVCTYIKAEVYRQLGQYQQAIDHLQTVLGTRPSEISVLVCLAQTHLDLGRVEISGGYLARAEESFVSAIHTSLTATEHSSGFRAVIWKIIADCLYFLGSSPFIYDESAVASHVTAATSLLGTSPSNRVSSIVSATTVVATPLDKTSVTEIAILAYDHRITLGSSESAAVGSAWFDLAVALRSLANRISPGTRRDSAQAQSTKCIMEAIRACPTIDGYWVALGDANFVSQPKIAQHAYIRALELNSKSAVTWTNLGLLYFYHNDVELANEAFYLAQSSDPDYSLAWLGQALVANAGGHSAGAIGILEHTIGLINIVPETDCLYASKGFSRHKESTAKTSSDALVPAFFVLDRYCKARPNDAAALHLFGLVCESIHQPDLAAKWISKAISLLEEAYEETEDSEVERQFTIAHCNIGRVKLALRDYDGALESFESALGLLPEDDKEEKVVTLRSHAQFGSGIAHFRQDNLEEALTFFESALQTAGGIPAIRGEITVMLAQALWAIGTEDTREAAKAKLLECISEDPENLVAITTLAAMGILTDDDGLIDAALSEILALPVDDRAHLDPSRNVDHLLIRHHLGQENPSEALAVAQKAVHTEPSVAQTRCQLATLLLQMKENEAVLPVLSGITSDNLESVRELLKLRAVSHTATGHEDATSLAQKSVMMRPSDTESWQILALSSST
ncbi:Superkiller protein 3 [Marasmius crinis-equi]|uniref:Superkiller protein 3 n=1 Tax=Marasmius crinis-equi TaxID=585013 RepID=A0ABR3F8G6_9AGAR